MKRNINNKLVKKNNRTSASFNFFNLVRKDNLKNKSFVKRINKSNSVKYSNHNKNIIRNKNKTKSKSKEKKEVNYSSNNQNKNHQMGYSAKLIKYKQKASEIPKGLINKNIMNQLEQNTINYFLNSVGKQVKNSIKKHKYKRNKNE